MEVEKNTRNVAERTYNQQRTPHNQTPMKKLLSLILILILSLMVLQGCGGPTKEDGRYYYEEEPDFSMIIPENWSISEGLMGSTMTAISPIEGKEDLFTENIAILAQEVPMTVVLEDLKEASINSAASMLDGFEELDSGTGTINDQDAIWYIYKYEMMGQNVKAIAYQLMIGKFIYIINGASSVDDFDIHRAELEEIINSFRAE